jgi:hypothetical protein
MRLWVVLDALATEPAGVEADQHDQQCRCPCLNAALCAALALCDGKV